MKGLFAISNRVDLTLSAGFEGFFDTTIPGRDTAYSPDNQNVNPHENFTYKDAQAAVNTPGFQSVLMLGLAYTF